MPALPSNTAELNLKVKEFHLKTISIALLLLLAFIVKIQVLKPSWGMHLYPLGHKPVLIPILLYSAPFIFLFYALTSRDKTIKFGLFDTLFGLIILMHLVSFFWINRGFHPVNPMLADLSMYFFYLLTRQLHSGILRKHTSFLLLLPLAPLSMEAGHGLLQVFQGIPTISGSLYNYNFLGMFLAMGVPVCVSQALNRKGGRFYRLTFLAALFLLGLLICRTSSRTAACGLAVALSLSFTVYYWPVLRKAWQRTPVLLRLTGGMGMVVSAAALSYWAYSLRPLSVLGRGLLARIGLHILAQNPFTGIGFGEISKKLALYQAEYFAMGNGSNLDRTLAGTPGAIISEYMERAVEHGLLGLLLYIPFWLLMLKIAFSLIGCRSESPEAHVPPEKTLDIFKNLAGRIARGENDDMSRFSAGAVIILFMVMSLSYSPYRIEPIYLYFCYVLGIAVSLYHSSKDSGPDDFQEVKT